MSTKYRRHPHSPEYADDGKTVVAAHDWLGHRFAVGDRVLYCIGAEAGRGLLMAFGDVVRIKCETKYWRDTREARPGETPTGINTYRDPPFAYVVEQKPYDEIKVQVHTRGTSGTWDHEERQKPTWVNAQNITALPLTPDVKMP